MGEPDEEGEMSLIATGDRDRLAEHLCVVADDIGNVKIAWREHLTAEELAAADVLTRAFLRLGGQIKRGEIANGERMRRGMNGAAAAIAAGQACLEVAGLRS